LNSDYKSTNVSIVSLEGEVLSSSIISSGSMSAGTSATLSGDVVLPHDRVQSGELVVIDRFPNGVVTWVDPASARVRTQLSVNTGFAANAHDYLELSPTKAYVARYFTNRAAGREPRDAGGDLLILDPSVPSIVGRIGLAGSADGYLPFPERMTRVGTEVVVTLGNMKEGFEDAGDGLVVGIDPASDSIAWRVTLPGLANCSGLALSPSQDRLAVSCSGVFAAGKEQAARSDVVLLDVTHRPPIESARYELPSKVAGRAVAPYLAFASDDILLAVAFGSAELGRGDLAFSIDTARGDVVPFAEGPAFSLGDLLCTPDCMTRCYLAHAGERAVATLVMENGVLRLGSKLPADPTTGLAPRWLGLL
jgi:hypothetical protein